MLSELQSNSTQSGEKPGRQTVTIKTPEMIEQPDFGVRLGK